jgi:hypothetical protein
MKHVIFIHFQRLKYGFFHLTRNWLLLYNYCCQYYILLPILYSVSQNNWPEWMEALLYFAWSILCTGRFWAIANMEWLTLAITKVDNRSIDDPSHSSVNPLRNPHDSKFPERLAMIAMYIWLKPRLKCINWHKSIKICLCCFYPLHCWSNPHTTGIKALEMPHFLWQTTWPIHDRWPVSLCHLVTSSGGAWSENVRIRMEKEPGKRYCEIWKWCYNAGTLSYKLLCINPSNIF